MFCVACGTQLPDEANFCLKCGKPQKADVRAPEPAPKYETCEIKFEVVKEALFGVGDDDLRFWAEALGPQGIYNAGESPVFKGTGGWAGPSKDQGLSALNALLQKLGGDGWDPLVPNPQHPDPQHWYGYRLQRRIE